MDLTEQAHLINKIQETLSQYQGKKVKVEQNLGRGRISDNTGIILQVHPRLFILEVVRKRGPKSRLSFQYADILTGVVTVYADGEPMFENYAEILSVKKDADYYEITDDIDANEEKILR